VAPQRPIEASSLVDGKAPDLVRGFPAQRVTGQVQQPSVVPAAAQRRAGISEPAPAPTVLFACGMANGSLEIPDQVRDDKFLDVRDDKFLDVRVDKLRSVQEDKFRGVRDDKFLDVRVDKFRDVQEDKLRSVRDDKFRGVQEDKLRAVSDDNVRMGASEPCRFS